MVAAASGSALTALTMTPFDVVKTRLQTQPVQSKQQPLFSRPPLNKCCQPANAPCVRNMSSLARQLPGPQIVCLYERGLMRTERVSGFVDAIRHVVRAEGIRGLWKGAGTTLMIGVPASSLYMLGYDYLLREGLSPIITSPTLLPLTAGIVARTSLATLLSPLELVRTNLQSTPKSPDKPQTLKGVVNSIRTVVKGRGVRFLWQGLGPTLWRDVPFSGIYWAGYESWKRFFESRGQRGTYIAFVSGAISGTTASLVTSPFDVLKTRRQALLMSNHMPSSSTATFALCAQIVRNEGASALFAGLAPRIAKVAPACGIMIACFEGIGGLLSKKEN